MSFKYFKTYLVDDFFWSHIGRAGDLALILHPGCFCLAYVYTSYEINNETERIKIIQTGACKVCNQNKR